MQNKRNKITPKRILNIMWDFAKTQVLATAVELDVFSRIGKARYTAEELAERIGASPRGLEMLLNSLTCLKLLLKDKKGNYRLSDDSGNLLVRHKPGYLGHLIMHTKQLNEAWGYLTKAVKTGKPPMSVDKQKDAEEFFPDLVKALFDLNYPAARYVAAHFKKKAKDISYILDVASGSGVWSIAFAQEFKSAKVTAIDFPSVIKVTRDYVRRFVAADRYRYEKGDLRTIDFGKNLYDLIILGHICHSEGKTNTEALIYKSFKALKERGSLLIAEFIPNDQKTNPVVPLLFALNMLLNTSEGDVFTVREFNEWLAACGFSNIELLKGAPSVSPLIIATKGTAVE